MTSPSPHPPNSLSNANDEPSASAPPTLSQKPAPQAWGLPPNQSTRRGLAPISTAFNPNQSRPSTASQTSAPRNPWSPAAAGPFAAVAAAAANITNPASSTAAAAKQSVRSSSISSSGSPFSPPAPTPGQLASSSSNPLVSGARTRTIASSSNPSLPSAAAASQSTGVAPTSGGGSASTKPSYRASPSLTGSNFGSPTLPSTSGASGAGKSGPLTQIVVAQLFLLLSTIKEDKDSPKWEQEADKIRKLVESNGMEVFTKYFRRLLLQNSSQIWGPNRGTETSGSYPILLAEVQKVTSDPQQPSKILESVEFGEGEIFKDFDLFTFMDHFKLSPQGKIILAAAFRKAGKSDLRTKAEAIISNNLQTFLNSVASTAPSQPVSTEEEAAFANVVDRLAQDPPRNWSNEIQQNLLRAFERRFHSVGVLVPLEISSTLVLFDLVNSSNPLVRLVQKNGPKATESLEACKVILESADMRDISYQQVASALLFMVIARDEPQYDPGIFISALKEHRGGQRLDWQDVVHALDREGLKITKLQFKRIFDALVPLALENENFDIQLLWGGEWRHEETQLAFAAAFLSFSENELDASQIPRLRKAYGLEDFEDASEEIKSYAETATKHPLVSIDATKALFNLVFQSSETYTHAQSFGVVDNIINPKMDLFVGSVSGVPKPWGALQDQAIKQLVGTLFFTGISGHGFALHLLWKRDKTWLSSRLFQLYQQNPLHLVPILELADEHGWLKDLIAANSELSLDLAALAHGRHLFDLDSWLQQITQTMQRDRVVPALLSFMNNKIEDDVATQKDKTPARTVPLTVRTAHALLTFLGNEGLHETERTSLQRASITAYPRLINYGEGFDEIIDASGRESNALSPEADAKMQEHYKQMYSSDIQVRDVVEVLQKYKMSQDPTDQDLFACMIFGLFDEYNCFGEYPLSALATTAVLFGSIINYNLLSKVALQVAISMVLEAVRDYQPHDSMYKFGLQALLQFQDRLEEWSRLSEILLEIPGLQGTPIYPVLEKIAQDKEEAPNGDQNDTEKPVSAADDFLAPEPNVPEFACLSADPPSRLDFYQEPDEQVQESVLFVLNNVSERNLKDKSGDLKSNLKDEHHQWFANYLVESRIKSQPNYHQLYMDILMEFNSKYLWAEVLRETIICVIRMLNAESTMSSSNERSHLKNLGAWLGSMTLARDQSIRHRNISFKDLLVEAHDTQRLLVAIPFTCKVLATAAHSLVFKPPCAWTVEILQILIELYEFSDLKLNLKFEIEVLCKTLDVDHKEIEAANVIRSRPLTEEEMLPTAISDGMEGFNDLSLIHLNRPRGMAERFSPATIVPQLAELSASLKHQYSLPPLNVAMQNRIRQLLGEAVERAISEIIGPVVERSVTIAAISASQLIAKDLAMESDAEKYREIAHKSVRALAGSLAQVTCKEPLRASMQNNIQQLRPELQETLPHGSVMMFINDNLDLVCNFVEKAAESASTNEIDAQIEEAMQSRQRHNYAEPQVSRWAYYIPDPYKPISGGLNPDQLAIYEDFSRTGRAFPVHSNLSQESARQIPDVLQDQYSNNFPSVADGPMAHPSAHPPFGDHPGRSAQDMPAMAMMNGFVNGQGLENRASDNVKALRQAAAEAIEADANRPLPESTAIRNAWVQLFREQMAVVNPAQKHEAALTAAKEAINVLVQGQDRPEVMDLMAQTLRKLCDGSDTIAQYIYTWCMDPHQERLFNASLTAALLKSGLIDVQRVDLVTASAIHERKPGVLEYLRELVDAFWLSDSTSSIDFPGAWRADLALSMAALTQWMSTDGSLSKGQEIKQSLEDSSLDLSSTQGDPQAVKEAQLEYIFNEWTRLQTNEASSVFQVSFAQQLYAQEILTSREETVGFLRACVNASVFSFEQVEARIPNSVDEVYIKTDALARLLVMIMMHQGKVNGAAKVDKVTFFNDTLSLLVLIFSHHYQNRGEMFNQKVFFRLYSTLISEIQSVFAARHGDSSEVVQGSMQALGKSFLMLSPRIFPAFSFSWLSLISHRSFMPALLKSPAEEGRTIFCELLCQQLSYVGELMKPLQIDFASKDLYRGTLKLLLVLHHDFPQFLAEYHLQILNNVPSHCTQMRSLIISASPAFPDFPDPFHEGLKVDRLDESRRPPVIRGGLEKIHNNQKVLDALQGFLDGNGQQDEHVNVIVQAICNPTQPETGPGFVPIPADIALLNSLVIYIVQQAESANRQRVLTFSGNSSYAQLMDALADNLNPEVRYYFFNAIANQLRYPNSHTHYLSYALFHLYRAGRSDRLALDLQQQILRVLLERIVAHRPHPWGLMVVLLEFLKNDTYHLWDAPFVKAAPDVQRMLTSLLQQMGQNARSLP